MFDEDDLANELFDPAQRDDLMSGVVINRGDEDSEEEEGAPEEGDAPVPESSERVKAPGEAALPVKNQ